MITTTTLVTMSIAHTATVSVYMVRALKTYPLSNFQVSNMILCSLSSVMSNSATLWTVAGQAPQSMEFSRQEYQRALPFLLQVIFLTQGSNLRLLRLLHWQTGS